MKSLSVVILAAGKGVRMNSALPKVLHQIGGVPILEHVVTTAAKLASKIYVICGHQCEELQAHCDDLPVEWIYQAEQLGTGHAVAQALPMIPDDNFVLTLMGDCPLIAEETLRAFVEQTTSQELGLITAILENPFGYGRIIRDEHDNVLEIVEEKDTSIEQQQIREINAGIFLVPAIQLKRWLPNLSNHNHQKEFYLTEIISFAIKENIPVKTYLTPNFMEIQGVNDRAQLAILERYYQRQLAEKLMISGITLLDPSRLDIRGSLEIQPDSTIDINCVFLGKNIIGRNVYIGANCVIQNSEIHDNVVIEPNTIIDSAIIESDCSIGPFARIRPGSHIMSSCKIGNFVEIKKTALGRQSKINHLSYIGDATVGERVTIGAGTITCNYDGFDKYPTIIKDDVFIGSDTQLIAPVTIGEGATIGAGSTIISNAPPHELTLSRAKQTTVPNWKRQRKKITEEK